MSDLAAFLRARFDEDDAVAVTWQQAHDPTLADAAARVLAEVAAKRAIIDLHVGEHECVGDRHGTLGTVLVAEGYIHELCPTVLALAQPYAEHPDFDPEWRA